MSTHHLPLGLLFAAGLLAACDTPVSVRQSALGRPVDFSYACEGDGATVAPEIDEQAASFNSTRICPDLQSGSQGALLGLVLNRFPASVTFAQLNPAAGTRRFLDADYFVPGTTGVPVGEDPLRIVRASDWSHFLIVSGGRGRLDRVVVTGLVDGDVSFEHAETPLPGPPADAVALGDTLVIAARDAAELWLLPIARDDDWTVAAPTFTRVRLPDAAAELNTIDDALLVTWRSRPVLSRVGLDGAVLDEVGLVPACRDGLDNDGDGLTDLADLDCLDASDDDESDASGAERMETLPKLDADSWPGAPSCSNGFDDNGDGLVDLADPACTGADADTEHLPACMNGADDDGDGLVDEADPDCLHGEGRSEASAPVDGPFSATFVDGGEYGRFVYVLDARRGRIAVFSYDEGALARVDVHSEDAFPPDLASVPFDASGAEPSLLEAMPAIRQPALRHQGYRDIPILSGNAFRLSNSRLRGELWERLVPGQSVPRALAADAWKPPACAPEGDANVCAQPEGDDATWVVYGASLDGRIQLFEAIRRGVPVHRLYQRQPDPSRRGLEISTPRLTLRGRLINARGQATPGFPFLGPAAQEVLAEAVSGESPQRLRRYGLWPADDFEEVPTETWSITYEGTLPGTRASSGRLLDAETFFDASQRFCELGVVAGDWLQLEVPRDGADPALANDLDVTLEDGRSCPTVLPESLVVEVRVVSVGMSTLAVDPASLRLRPQLPALDVDAVRAEGLSQRLCQQALTALDETLQREENLAAGATPLAPAMLPAFVRYRVRPDAMWVAVGAVSGYLHRQRWDRAEGLCVTDDTLDPRLEGRIQAVPDAVSRYDACPPSDASLAFDRVDAVTGGAPRFSNPSFSLDLFPACETTEDGGIAAIPTQQETSFTFTVTGPQSGSALSVSDSMLLARVPLLDARRHQVQLDAGRNRLSILQLRFGDLKEITTLE